jgi:hypothetical protein
MFDTVKLWLLRLHLVDVEVDQKSNSSEHFAEVRHIKVPQFHQSSWNFISGLATIAQVARVFVEL